jgi:hypothetical protein
MVRPATRGAGGGPNGTSDAGRRGLLPKGSSWSIAPRRGAPSLLSCRDAHCRWPIEACAVGVERRLVVVKVVAVQSCTGWLGSSRRALGRRERYCCTGEVGAGSTLARRRRLGAERLALGRLCTEVFQAQPLLGRRRRSAHHAPPATSTAPMARNGHTGIPPEAAGAAAGGPGRPVPAVVNWNGHEPDTT